MFCENCGAQMKDGSRFCAECGAPVIREDVNPLIDQQIDQPIDNLANVRALEQGNHSWKGGKGLIIALAIVSSLLVVALVVGGIWLFTNRSDRDGLDDVQTTSGTEIAQDEGDSENDSVVENENSGNPQEVSIEIHQVDNSTFPQVTFYASITEIGSDKVVDGLTKDDFVIRERDAAGGVTQAKLADVYKVVAKADEKVSMNLVLDASGSMDEYRKMDQAKNAANALIDTMDFARGDQIEIISFDDYVYLNQGFSSDASALRGAVANIHTGDCTALYDGLYAGLYQTYTQPGVKCVVGFTDGEENASSYTYNDVVALARNTGIPVYIIGIGDDYDVTNLQNLARDCSGKYYSSSEEELQAVLEDIYVDLYQEQQDYYVFKFESTNTSGVKDFRTIELQTAENSVVVGSYSKEYIPDADVSGNFSDSYMGQDFILDFSSDRQVTESDLQGLSLAQLRIARNEIFARHGRQFKDPMLNQWFYSKDWYLNIPYKYAPDYFDQYNPNPLSKMEQENAEFIKAYEQNLMANYDIYPNAGTELLSQYDLALSKPVLKTALNQVKGYPQTGIRDENIQMIQTAIDQEEIKY